MYLKLMAQQLWITRRTALIALAVLIVVNLGLFLVLQQIVTPQVSAREQSFLQRQNEVRQLLRQRGGAGNTPEQRFIRALQSLEGFQKLVPEHREFTGLIEELLELSGQARLDLTQIAYNHKLLEEEDLLQYSLSFSLVGDYAQIKKFIHALEQSPRLLAITEIGLQGVQETIDKQAGVNLRLRLETYFRADDKGDAKES